MVGIHTGWTLQEDYADYKYLLNLPGSTHGSYSRNLNHLWALGSVVLQWTMDAREFYYPALVAGQQKGAKIATSKAPISVVFHSFWLIFGRVIISRNGLEA